MMCQPLIILTTLLRTAELVVYFVVFCINPFNPSWNDLPCDNDKRLEIAIKRHGIYPISTGMNNEHLAPAIIIAAS